MVLAGLAAGALEDVIVRAAGPASRSRVLFTRPHGFAKTQVLDSYQAMRSGAGLRALRLDLRRVPVHSDHGAGALGMYIGTQVALQFPDLRHHMRDHVDPHACPDAELVLGAFAAGIGHEWELLVDNYDSMVTRAMYAQAGSERPTMTAAALEALENLAATLHGLHDRGLMRAVLCGVHTLESVVSAGDVTVVSGDTALSTAGCLTQDALARRLVEEPEWLSLEVLGSATGEGGARSGMAPHEAERLAARVCAMAGNVRLGPAGPPVVSPLACERVLRGRGANTAADFAEEMLHRLQQWPSAHRHLLPVVMYGKATPATSPRSMSRAQVLDGMRGDAGMLAYLCDHGLLTPCSSDMTGKTLCLPNNEARRVVSAWLDLMPLQPQAYDCVWALMYDRDPGAFSDYLNGLYGGVTFLGGTPVPNHPIEDSVHKEGEGPQSDPPGGLGAARVDTGPASVEMFVAEALAQELDMTTFLNICVRTCVQDGPAREEMHSSAPFFCSDVCDENPITAVLRKHRAQTGADTMVLPFVHTEDGQSSAAGTGRCNHVVVCSLVIDAARCDLSGLSTDSDQDPIEFQLNHMSEEDLMSLGLEGPPALPSDGAAAGGAGVGPADGSAVLPADRPTETVGDAWRHLKTCSEGLLASLDGLKREDVLLYLLMSVGQGRVVVASVIDTDTQEEQRPEQAADAATRAPDANSAPRTPTADQAAG